MNYAIRLMYQIEMGYITRLYLKSSNELREYNKISI